MSASRRVLLRTSLSQATGYGRDGIGIAQAFINQGWDVHLRPQAVDAPLPAEVAVLLTKTPDGPFDLFLHHSDPASLGLYPGEGRSAKTRVAWTMWEFTGLGPDFDEPIGPRGQERTIEQRLDSYDSLVVYDEVSKQALEPRTQRPVTKLQGGYVSEETALLLVNAVPRDWFSTPFRFCMVGQLGQRKNPFAAIEAFSKLKSEHGDDFNAELHLKTVDRTLHPKIEEVHPGIKIHYELWSRRQLLEFYLKCHCLLAPSWGEGKNLPALEAMTTGLPVIGPKFGGHAEWMADDWAYPVNFTMAEHAPGMGSARVSPDDLAERMWHVYSNRAEARQKGELAARVIPAMMDWDKVIPRLTMSLGL